MQKDVHVDVVLIEVVHGVQFDLNDEPLNGHVPLGHLVGQHEGEQFATDALLSLRRQIRVPVLVFG